MSTSVEAIAAAVVKKAFSKEDIAGLAIKLRPILVKEVQEQLLKELKGMNMGDALYDALSDAQYDLARGLAKQVVISINPKKKKVKK